MTDKTNGRGLSITYFVTAARFKIHAGIIEISSQRNNMFANFAPLFKPGSFCKGV